MKTDVVMWSKGKKNILPRVFEAIDKELDSRAGKKIFVIGDMKDEGIPVARDYNWEVYCTNRWSIPTQANEALSHVETEFFVSVENDVILTSGWYDRIIDHMKDPKVAVAQGIRYYTNPHLRNWLRYAWGDIRSPLYRPIPLGISIDNNMYRTSAIREVGGFSYGCEYCSDSFLKAELDNAGYTWLVDRSIKSEHVWDGVMSLTDHRSQAGLKCHHRDDSYVENFWKRYGSKVLELPVISIDMAIRTRDPFLVFIYPYTRFRRIPITLIQRMRWRAEGMKRVIS
jgi:hypothetical protein